MHFEIYYICSNLLQNLIKYSSDVYEEDYELYKQLVEHFDKRDNVSILDKMRYVNFMKINSEGMLVPRLKETA